MFISRYGERPRSETRNIYEKQTITDGKEKDRYGTGKARFFCRESLSNI
jgi:hypothetical protein